MSKLEFSNVDFRNFILIKPKHKIKVITETLSRLGIGNHDEKILYQTCHIVKINNSWYLMHYKEGFLLQGRECVWREGDLERRNEIAIMLENWGLIEILNSNDIFTSYGVDINEAYDAKVYKIKNDEKKNYRIKRKIDIRKLNNQLRIYNEGE